MEYRSQWPTLILRSNVGSYWFILTKYDVHTSNSRQDIRQNHWTMKYRSCWPSLHDPQVHVTRLSHVRPTICISLFHNRKVEKHFLKVSYILTSSPTRGMDPGVRSHGMKANPPGYLWSKDECFLMSGWWDILHSSCLHVKLWSNSTNGTEVQMNEHMNGWTERRKHMNGWTERRKLYTPRHKCHVGMTAFWWWSPDVNIRSREPLVLKFYLWIQR